MSHNSVNRLLQREDFSPKALFLEASAKLILEGGTLSVDDSVLEKPPIKYTYNVVYYYAGNTTKLKLSKALAASRSITQISKGSVCLSVFASMIQQMENPKMTILSTCYKRCLRGGETCIWLPEILSIVLLQT